MSRIVCTRVACLRLPWFPIDVLRRTGHVAKGSPVALVHGQGSQAQTSLVDPAGRALGLTRLMSPSRARALVANVQLIPWDASVDALLRDATETLTRALERVTPRHTLVAPGRWWLEPADPRRGASTNRRMCEEAFARRVLTCAEEQGFPGARVAIADGPVAAEAGTRVGAHAVLWIAPGEDDRFLGGLPVAALPLGERTLRLLGDLGLHTVRALQAMGPQALEARFGPEGRQAWEIARGHDPRRPRTPNPRATARVVLPLLEGVHETEPLLFVLRPALDRLVAAQAHTGQAIACLGLTLERAWGSPHALVLTPSRAVSDPRLLLELVRLRLCEELPEAHHLTGPEQGPVVTLVLEALRAAPQRPRQTDLFTTAVRTTGDAEGALIRLTGRLGPDAVQTAVVHDERRPEQAGSWLPLTTVDHPDPDPDPDHDHGCLRLLPSPRALESPGARPERVTMGSRVLHLTRWLGPERLSGHWWAANYDRDYYWASTREGWALWLFRDRSDKRWFLHGWLD